MAYEEIARATFNSCEDARKCMDAIDKFEPWDTARQYGCASRDVTFTSAIKNPEAVAKTIELYGGMLN